MGFSYEDNMSSALRQYLDIRKNVDPATEVKRRAKNIVIKLVVIYGDAAPSKEEITAKLKSLGYHVKIRQRLKDKKGKNGKGLTLKRLVILETRARIGARKFTATGWFPALQALGGNPKLKGGGKPGGVIRGTLLSKLSGLNPTVTFINGQEGAQQTDARAEGAIEQAYAMETADMIIYIERKLDEAAQKAGLQ